MLPSQPIAMPADRLPAPSNEAPPLDALAHALAGEETGAASDAAAPAQLPAAERQRLERLLVDSDAEGYFRAVYATTAAPEALVMAALAGLGQLLAPALGPNTAAAARELLIALADADYVARGGEPAPMPEMAGEDVAAAPSVRPVSASSAVPGSAVKPQQIRAAPAKLAGAEIGAVLSALSGRDFDQAFDRLVKGGR